MKSYLAIGAGIVLSLCLFGLIVEVTDTNDYNLLSTDPATGLARYTPNSSFITSGDCYENTVEVNNLGLHGPAVSPVKDKNTFRVLVIGSSYAAALQVPVDEMYTTVLENKLNANPHRGYTYEVIPLAFNQNGTFLDILYYLNYGASLEPDLVIDIETDYELLHKVDTPSLDAEGAVILTAPKYGESSTVAFLRTISRHSKFSVNIYNRYLVFRGALDAFLSEPLPSIAVSSPTPTSTSSEASAQQERMRWQMKEKFLSILAEHVKKDNAHFLFTSWTGSWVATSTAQEFPRHMADIAARYNFSYVDLAPRFQLEEGIEGTRGVFSCDPHWSPEGNRYIAESLFMYLSRNPDLLSNRP